MKILFVHDPPDLYGASRALLRMASRLATDGHTVLVVLPGEGPLARKLLKNAVQVMVCPKMAVLKRKKTVHAGGLVELAWNYVVSIRELMHVVAKFRPDLVHSNSAVVLPAGVVARIKRIPHLWHIREIFSDFPKLWMFYQWYIAAFSDRIVCVSQAVADQFDPRIRLPKLVVLHDGVPAAEFPDVSPEKVTAFRSKYKLDGNLLVGLVGRIKIGRKGQDVFLSAAARLKSRFPQTRFMFIGSPFPGNEDHLVQLQRLIKDKGMTGEMIYTGDIEDVTIAYAALDISVQSSVLPEAFGLVVAESMAMSKPVIASRNGGTIEQIDDGVTGILVKPGDADQLASALEKLHEDPELRATLGANGKKKFLEKFEFEVFYRKLLTLQTSLIKS